jgi:hypothetical protein
MTPEIPVNNIAGNFVGSQRFRHSAIRVCFADRAK